MEFTQADREELYQIWMSKKAKLRLTQMEVARNLGLSQNEFSDLLRGRATLTLSFIRQFCKLMHIEPEQAIQSLRNRPAESSDKTLLKTRIKFDGEVQNVYLEGDEVVVEYKVGVEK